MDLDLFSGTIARALIFSTPLLWAALGEIYAERAGVVNLGVEGMMILSAVVGFMVGQSTELPWLGLLVAALVGMLVAWFHAFVSITLRANQYVSGLAITIFGIGLSGLLGQNYVGKELKIPISFFSIPSLKDIPFFGKAFFTEQYLLTYIGLLVAVLLWFVLYHTRLGLVLRTVGESPVAADVAGINVTRVRYLAVMFGGLMSGMAGGFLSLSYYASWIEGVTNGMGWIALALAIFAIWDPIRCIGAAFLFGIFFTLQYRLQEVFSPQLLSMMPFVFTIVALIVIALGKGRRAFGAPEALGIPYQRGER